MTYRFQQYYSILMTSYSILIFNNGSIQSNLILKVWDIMRAFCEINKPVHKNMKAGDAASLILAKASVTVVDFTVPPQLKGPKKHALRFAPNPGNLIYLDQMQFNLILIYFITSNLSQLELYIFRNNISY